MDLSQRIKAARGSLSQAEFGKRIGISQTSIGNYESGIRFPDSKTIVAICKTFGVSSEWLLMGAGPMYKKDCLSFGENKMSDGRTSEEKENRQHIENIDSQENETVRCVGQTGNADILDRYLKAVDENAALIRENADLRVQAERHQFRIRELERENEELRKMRKGASRFYDQTGQDVG